MASRENFSRFQEENPGIQLTYTQWANVIYLFNYGIRDEILDTGTIFKLPWGLGKLTISKKKRKKLVTLPTGEEKVNLAVDWKKTKEKGRYIYHMNYHTDGFSFKWKWFPETARFKYHRIWVFKPSRVSSRLITHYLKTYDAAIKYHEWHTVKIYR